MTQIYFIDQVGASRKTVEECRGGVEHIMVGDKVYWPLTAEGTKRLIRAGCGDGEFTEPAPDEFAPRTPVPTAISSACAEPTHRRGAAMALANAHGRPSCQETPRQAANAHCATHSS